MHQERIVACRADFLLPLAEPDPGRRIADGYLVAQGEEILELGSYEPAVGERLRAAYGDRLEVIGGALLRPETAADPLPRLRGAILPGFVKAHGHDHEQPIIGVAKDEPLTAWLDHAVNPFTGFINSHRQQLSEALGCTPQYATYRMARLVDIHYGITASMVHHCNHNKYHLEDIARANEAAGTTMIVAIGGQDRFYVKELLDSPADAMARLERALEIQAGCSRTTFCPGPDQLFSNSRAVLVPQKAWAREHGTLFHIHSSEEPNTTAWFQAEIEPGMTPVQFADSIGILDEHSVLAHQVNNGPQDIEILARTGTRVVHNPLANTILGSGMPPILDMIAAGVPVAISTDGSGSADNQNIIAAARLAAQYQKARLQDATVLPSEQLLRMITSIPADILRLPQGSLRPGLQADFVVLDLSRPNLCPTRLDNLMENIIWAADGAEISTVVARGRLLKHDGAVLPFADGSTPQATMAAVQELSERFATWRETAPELRGTGAHH
jgi:5-methylthioadenosine/S-adenosylhomocysteine deaminase